MTGRIWYISDPHFYHLRVAELRGMTVEENNEAICQAWSKAVKPSDTVWVLGDISVSKHTEALELIKTLPGKKHLVPGNHDPVHPMHKTYQKSFRAWLDVFETISPFVRKKWQGQDVFFSHFPMDTLGNYYSYALKLSGSDILLHGHTHDSEKIRGNMINMCWEAWGRMCPQEEIIEDVLPKVHRNIEEWRNTLEGSCYACGQ